MQFAVVEEVPRGGRALLCSTERCFSSSDKVPLKVAVAGKEREVNCQINGGCSLSLCSAKHHIQYLHFSCAAATEKSSRKCSFSRYQATSGGRGRRRKSSHKHFQFPLPPPKGEGKGLQAKGLKKAKNTATSGLIGYLLRSFSSEIRALELCTPEYLPHTVQVYIV